MNKGVVTLIYRVKTYRINEEKLEVFNEFFHEYLLPNQKKHGALLVGRWVDSSKKKITAIWKYESYQEYERIEQQIQQTELHKQAKRRKLSLPPLFLESHQEFWEMTGDYEKERI
jgi:hypothetical protein